MPKTDRFPAATPVECLDVDFGDTELTVVRYPDGMYVLRIPGGASLLLNEDQLQTLVGAFVRFGKEQGWT